MPIITAYGKSDQIYYFHPCPIEEKGYSYNRIFAITKSCKEDDKETHHHLLYIGYCDSSNPLPDLEQFVEKGATHISFYEQPNKTLADQIISDIKDNYEFGIEH